MKKSYSKPEIVFESFSLSTNIAACEVSYDGFSQGICVIYGTGGTAFFNSSLNSNCEFDVNDPSNLTTSDGFCYDVPTAGNVLFNS